METLALVLTGAGATIALAGYRLHRPVAMLAGWFAAAAVTYPLATNLSGQLEHAADDGPAIVACLVGVGVAVLSAWKPWLGRALIGLVSAALAAALLGAQGAFMPAAGRLVAVPDLLGALGITLPDLTIPPEIALPVLSDGARESLVLAAGLVVAVLAALSAHHALIVCTALLGAVLAAHGLGQFWVFPGALGGGLLVQYLTNRRTLRVASTGETAIRQRKDPGAPGEATKRRSAADTAPGASKPWYPS